MGLLISVYRNSNGGDCTNGGVTASANQLCLVNVDGPFEPRDGLPPAWLVPGNVPNAAKIVIADPHGPDRRWSMFGGNYAGTSDSRFTGAVKRLCGTSLGVVPVHDRYEP